MNYCEMIADKVLKDERLSYEDVSKLIYEPFNEIINGALRIKKNNVGHIANLCTILNAKSGRCGEDCRYCAQSAHYNTDIEEYSLLSKEEILSSAIANAENGVDYFSIVTSGRKLSEEEFACIIEAVKEIKSKTPLKVCVSSGLLSQEEFLQLKEAGVSNYHHNLQTSADYFENIITTHSFEDKIQTIKSAMKAGLQVCAGGIIGMGETFQDRISLAFTLKELGILNIPINILVPIKGTPLENTSPITKEEILRTIAIIRFINPRANLIYGAGRKTLGESEFGGYIAGINSVITGDCLTTTGSSVDRDKKFIERAKKL